MGDTRLEDMGDVALADEFEQCTDDALGKFPSMYAGMALDRAKDILREVQRREAQSDA